MVAKARQNTKDSPRVQVGEIDTKAPFQSVKHAVTLFGEVAFSEEKPASTKPKAYPAERVLVEETQLHLAQKELNKLRDQVDNAEKTKARALAELKKAKFTVEELIQKLKPVGESKDSAIEEAEAARNQVKQIEETKSDDLSVSNGASSQALESAREQYIVVYSELDAAKQELRKTRQEHDISLEAKLAAFNQAVEAENVSRANVETVGELSKEITSIQESIGQVKLAALEALQEQVKMFAEKDTQMQSYKACLEATTNKLLALKNEFDPELARNLGKQLSETMDEIGMLQKQMESAKASDVESERNVTLELGGAKETLQKVAEEESFLRSLVESLQLKLENLKEEHSKLKEQEVETESSAGNLHVKLHKSKSELEAAIAEESKVRGVSEEMISTLQQLSSEAENLCREAEEMKSKAEELKKVAEATSIALEEAEKKLTVALEEAEEAKTAEARALDQIKTMWDITNAARASISDSGAKITISREEFDVLSRKAEESDLLAEMKVAAVLAQVEAVKASENEAMKMLEAMENEMNDMKKATEEALKKAEMAEAAKRAVQGELQRWHEREQKKAAETASRILAEAEMSSESSPQHHKYQMQKPLTYASIEVQNLDKKKTCVSRKARLPNVDGIFNRKKNQIVGGSPYVLG